MTEYIEAIQRLAEQFGRLSGVGRKSAIRMAFSLIELDNEAAEEFAAAIIEAKQRVHECPICGKKFRFHCTIGTWIADEDEFDMYLYYKARSCQNDSFWMF